MISDGRRAELTVRYAFITATQLWEAEWNDGTTRVTERYFSLDALMADINEFGAIIL